MEREGGETTESKCGAPRKKSVKRKRRRKERERKKEKERKKGKTDETREKSRERQNEVVQSSHQRLATKRSISSNRRSRNYRYNSYY